METTSTARESAPVQREVAVSAAPETAFALFTAHLGSWWPLDDKNVLGPGASVAFEDLQLVERLGSARSVWGDVIECKPPASLRLAFYPGRGPDQATDLLVTFEPTIDGTLVSLVHRGWGRLSGDESAAGRIQVEQGWEDVFDAYRHQVETGGLAGR